MRLDPEQFRELYLEHREALAGFLRRLTGDAVEADDLLQETFLSVWRKRARHFEWENPSAYLRAVSFRLFLSRRRRDVRRRALEPARAATPDVLPHEDVVAGDEERRVLVERVTRAVALLPPPLREAFDLYRVRGLRVGEIALLTGANPKTVETRIRRATLLVAEALRPASRQECTSHG
jgi:RNA polymerase sigma-70 factor (ECF subfamily)